MSDCKGLDARKRKCESEPCPKSVRSNLVANFAIMKTLKRVKINRNRFCALRAHWHLALASNSGSRLNCLLYAHSVAKKLILLT